MSVLATSILIVAVLASMQVGCDIVAFAHGWQDGPWNYDPARHAWIPRAFYALGWRSRRARENALRDALAADHARADAEREAAEQ